MKKWLALAFLFLCFGIKPITAQNNFALKGYVKNMQTTWDIPEESYLMNWNTFHNRLDVQWKPLSFLSLDAGIRNTFTWGEFVSLMKTMDPDYIKKENRDFGFLDLTSVLAHDTSWILKSQADRLFSEIELGKLNIRIGRQRINWGIGLVWNPNDIFNTFSFFDFDYEERPGCDAIRLEYYTGNASSLQFAVSMNRFEQITAAMMYRFNAQGFDIQCLLGKIPVYGTLGFGWAGDIFGAGFRGEMTWFKDIEVTNGDEHFLATLDLDYTLSSGLYLHAAALFNSSGTTGLAGGGNFLTLTNLSPLNLTRARYSLFTSVNYPLSPILGLGFSSMFNPSDASLYFGPALDISLTENIGFLVNAQIFEGEKESEFGNFGRLFFLRLKYNF